MSELPTVSIIVPCRNEDKFIGNCLDSITINDYPKERLEVLVVDGMSDDASRGIVNSYIKRFPFIKLLDNPDISTPYAFNVGINYSQADIIIIMGSHSVYERDYISKCVRYLSEYDADNVGGVMITLPRDDSFMSKAIAQAISCRFGVGKSDFRIGSKKPKWVETVFGGCYKREIFKKIGLFNVNLKKSQDFEFNLRLRSKGGRILLSPDIVSYYYARSDITSFIKHNFINGVWAIFPFKYSTRLPVSLRHLVPLIFVLTLLIFGLSSYFSTLCLLIFSLLVAFYISFSFYSSAQLAMRKKDLRLLFIMPIIFAMLHLTYGVGSAWGLLRVSISKRFWSNLRSISR